MSRMLSAAVLLAGLSGGLESADPSPIYSRGTIDLGIVVSDLERSVKFYRDDLGFAPAGTFDVGADIARDAGISEKDLHVTVLAIDTGETATRLKLIGFPEAKRSDVSGIEKGLGVRYLTLYVKDMDAIVARMKERSVPIEGKGPVTLPGGVAIALVRDPDGNFVEFVGRSGKTAGAPGGFRPLFDGRSLAGWRPVKNGVWKVEDGAIVGEQGEKSGGGWLITDSAHGDFELSFKFRMTRGGNSGVAFRFPPDDLTPSKSGYECQISEADPKCRTGGIFGVKDAPGGLLRDGWNEGRIVAKGRSLSTFINGKEAVAVEDTRAAKGRIGIQVHGTDLYNGMRVEFKDIEIRE